MAATAYKLSLNTAWVQIPPGSREKDASYLGLGGDLHRTLRLQLAIHDLTAICRKLRKNETPNFKRLCYVNTANCSIFKSIPSSFESLGGIYNLKKPKNCRIFKAH